MTRYRTIVADPPWAIDRLGALSWRAGRPSGTGLSLDYNTMPFPEPRLEMFSRRARLGWDTWGNEALGHVDLDGNAA